MTGNWLGESVPSEEPLVALDYRSQSDPRPPFVEGVVWAICGRALAIVLGLLAFITSAYILIAVGVRPNVPTLLTPHAPTQLITRQLTTSHDPHLDYLAAITATIAVERHRFGKGVKKALIGDAVQEFVSIAGGDMFDLSKIDLDPKLLDTSPSTDFNLWIDQFDAQIDANPVDLNQLSKTPEYPFWGGAPDAALNLPGGILEIHLLNGRPALLFTPRHQTWILRYDANTFPTVTTIYRAMPATGWVFEVRGYNRFPPSGFFSLISPGSRTWVTGQGYCLQWIATLLSCGSAFLLSRAAARIDLPRAQQKIAIAGFGLCISAISAVAAHMNLVTNDSFYFLASPHALRPMNWDQMTIFLALFATGSIATLYSIVTFLLIRTDAAPGITASDS